MDVRACILALVAGGLLSVPSLGVSQVGSRDLLIASTHRFGGSGSDIATDLVVHANGDAYVAGVVGSFDFPGTSTATHTNGGVGQRFVARLDARTGSPVFVAIVGAPSASGRAGVNFGRDEVEGLAVDAAGNAYVVAYESSHDYPVSGGTYRASSPRKYVYRVAAAGTVTRHSLALDPAIARVAAIALDAAGNLLLTGSAGAGLVTTPGAPWGTASVAAGCIAPYLARLSADGQTVQLATYLGHSGTGTDLCGGRISAGNFDPTGFALAVDAAGNIFVTGQAEPGLRATSGAIDYASTQPTPYVFGGLHGTASHAFVARFSAQGTLAFVARLGSSTGRDRGTSIAIDPSGGIVLAGKTTSINFPGVGNFSGGSPWAWGDCSIATPEFGFVAKLSVDGTQLLFSGYVPAMGGQLDDCGSRAMGEFSPLRVALDAAGRVVVVGETSSSRRDVRATPTSLEPVPTGSGLLFGIDGNGSQVWHATTVEGIALRGVALDPWGHLVVLDRGAVLRRISPFSMPVKVTVDSDPACDGVPVVATAWAAATYGAGSIELSVDNVPRGTVPVIDDRATFVVNLATGIRRLKATYRGTGAFDGYASSTLLLQVNQAGTCE